MKVTISFYQDTRRVKESGLYPLRLQVYSAYERKRKYYNLNFDTTENDFQKVFTAKKPRLELRTLRIKLEAIKSDATKVAESIKPFSFEVFEQQYFKITKAKTVKSIFELIIDECIKTDKIGRATAYNSSLKKLLEFNDYKNKKNNTLQFKDINKKWLEDFQRWYTTIHITARKKYGSLTSVGIICRDLRAVFNRAINEKTIAKELYPFGLKAYQIPTGGGTSRALNLEELKLLANSEPQTFEQQRAKDFWLFSYACNGINISDVCRLRRTDYNQEENTISYIRKKTATKKKENHIIEVPLNDYALNHIEMYRAKKGLYLFDVLADKDTETEKVRKIKNFTSGINSGIKKLAKSLGITSKISTYYARHTFADLSLKSFGASMEQISDALNHSSIKTTQNYVGSFNRETKKALNDNLFNF